MDTVRILHKHWGPGYGWSYTSPDVPSMTGGEDTYEASVREAEAGVRFTLECEADERGQDRPNLSGLTFEHYRTETAREPIAA